MKCKLSIARVCLTCALLGWALLGCDTTQENTTTTKEQKALEEPTAANKLTELAPLRDNITLTYDIYEITPKDTQSSQAKSAKPYRAKLYLKQQDSRIVSAAFSANGNRFSCALHSTLETDEYGVANGTLDCQKLFNAVIEQGKLASPKLITQNLASLLPQKDISDIANATTPTSARLRKISSFSTRLHTYIQMDSTNTRGIRLDSICSPNPHIQKLINASMYEYLKPLRIPEPKSCTQASTTLTQIAQAMLKQLTKDTHTIQYYGYDVDFFDEQLLQIHKTTYLGLSYSTLAHNSKHLLYRQKGNPIALDKELLTKGESTQKLRQALESKYQQFLQANPQCQPIARLNAQNPDVAMSDSGVSFIYMPSSITTHNCNQISLDFHLYELQGLISPLSAIYPLVAQAKAPSPQENALETLYLECGKCAITTKHTQEQILALRKSLNDEHFYEKTSEKAIDKELLSHYDITLQAPIYNGDYTAIDFNHKYLLPLNTLDSTEAYYILYTDGKAPYCVQDISDNAEIIKYFSLSGTIEVKGQTLPIDTYLQQNHINMQENICTRKAKPLRD